MDLKFLSTKCARWTQLQQSYFTRGLAIYIHIINVTVKQFFGFDVLCLECPTHSLRGELLHLC